VQGHVAGETRREMLDCSEEIKEKHAAAMEGTVRRRTILMLVARLTTFSLRTVAIMPAWCATSDLTDLMKTQRT
jgi:hypothetical protein